MGLSKRKPIYIPFPQAIPQVPVIDPETCIQFKIGQVQEVLRRRLRRAPCHQPAR